FRSAYGYYLDHIFDAFSTVFFLGGIVLSGLAFTNVWVWGLIMILISMIHIQLRINVTKIINVSVSGFGATEARILLFVVNIIFFFNPNLQFMLYGTKQNI